MKPVFGVFVFGLVFVAPLLPLLVSQKDVASLKTWIGFGGLWGENRDISGLVVDIPIYIVFGDKGLTFPDLVPAVQVQLDSELNLAGSRFHYTLVDKLEESKTGFDPKDYEDDYAVVLYLHGDSTIVVHENTPHAMLLYPLSAVHANDLPYFIVQSLMDHLLYPDLYGREADRGDYKAGNKEGAINTVIEGTFDEDSVNLDIVYVGDSSLLNAQQIISKCIESFNVSNNFMDIQVPNSTMSLEEWEKTKNNRTFYFQISNTTIDGIYTISPEATDFTDFQVYVVDTVLYWINVSPHPSNNINLRLGGLLKHKTMDNFQMAANIPKAEYNQITAGLKSDKINWTDLYALSKQLVES